MAQPETRNALAAVPLGLSVTFAVWGVVLWVFSRLPRTPPRLTLRAQPWTFTSDVFALLGRLPERQRRQAVAAGIREMHCEAMRVGDFEVTQVARRNG